MSDAEHADVLRRLLRIDKNFPMGGDPMIDCERAAIERAIELLESDQYSKGYEQAMIDEGYGWGDK